METATGVILRANRLRGIAARRQVLADTLKCCIVSEHEIQSVDGPAFADVAYDLDSVRGPFAVISRKRKDIPPSEDSVVQIRCEGEVPASPDAMYTPETREMSLSLCEFGDAYNSEELLQEVSSSTFPYRIVKTIPWFDEFEETVHVTGSVGFDTVSRVVVDSFCRLKKHYMRLSQLHSSAFTHHWQPVVAEGKLQVLQRNFPKGVLGLRALHNTEDPRAVRALVMKDEDEVRRLGRHAHILGRRFGEAELDGIYSVGAVTPAEQSEPVDQSLPETKYAYVPDLGQAWSCGLPRVMFRDDNRRVLRMADVERETNQGYAVWTLAEVRVFLERLGTYGKNFRKISASIIEKSEKDCADFYFRFKIILNMKVIVNAGTGRKYNGKPPVEPNGVLPSPSGGHRVFVEEILDLVADEPLFTHATLERLNKKFQHAPHVVNQTSNPEKLWTDTSENPLSERKSALIDILSNAISKGLTTLGIFDSTPVPTPPPKMLTLQTIPIVKPTMAAFSVVKTETAVLVPRSVPPVIEAPVMARQLQSHNTI